MRIVVKALRSDDAELDEARLAQDRANAFRQYLEHLNVPSDKIIVETEDVLLDTGNLPSLRQRNKLRRVDIYIVKNNQPGGGKKEYQASANPTRAQTEDEYAITSALGFYALFCGLGGDVPSDTPEEPTEEPRNFIEKFFSGLGEAVTEEFQKAMSDEVMAQQSQIPKHLHDVLGTDPEAELGSALTAKTLDVAYPSTHSSELPKDGRIDCFPVDPSDSPKSLQSIREECGTFVVHTIEDATLTHPQATLRFDLVLFPEDESNSDTPPPDAPRYIQPTLLHLAKDPEWKIIAIQTRAGETR
ncbi:MAG: hypothetical protein IT364_03150 [Candidatus Hydrogenedentes bacterium]|nr:hypothetical protein [Candidatus Hydrogenedentota bacterium]